MVQHLLHRCPPSELSVQCTQHDYVCRKPLDGDASFVSWWGSTVRLHCLTFFRSRPACCCSCHVAAPFDVGGPKMIEREEKRKNELVVEEVEVREFLASYGVAPDVMIHQTAEEENGYGHNKLHPFVWIGVGTAFLANVAVLLSLPQAIRGRGMCVVSHANWTRTILSAFSDPRLFLNPVKEHRTCRPSKGAWTPCSHSSRATQSFVVAF